MDKPNEPAQPAAPDPLAVRYIGAGNHLIGVPARDLTVSEWAGLPEETRALALGLGLYAAADDAAEE